MTRLIPFKKEHLEIMDVRDHEKAFLTIQGLIEYMERSVAVTGIIDGRIIGCGGVSPFAMGNAEIWLVPSVYVTEHTVEFSKAVRKWLFQIREDLALNRMQTDCLDDDLHNGWMTFLGFDREGTRKRYFNGKDYGIWGKTWEV